MSCPDCNACEPGECMYPDDVMCAYLRGDYDRWTLTQRGWCEAMGISSDAAEALDR